jgi:hypothetical protein
MSIVAGQVTQINGKYIVICKDGSSKALSLNDTIYEGEEIKAEGGSHLVISNGENDFVASVYANFMIINGESVTPHCNDGCGDEIRVFEQESFDEVAVQTDTIIPFDTVQTQEFVATDSSTVTYGGGGGGSVASRYVEDTTSDGYAHAEASGVSGYTTNAQTISNSSSGIGNLNIAEANAESTTNITNIISDDIDELQLIDSIEEIIDQKLDEIHTEENIYSEKIEINDVLPQIGDGDRIDMSNLKEDYQSSQKEQIVEKDQSSKDELLAQDLDSYSNISVETNSIIEVDQY